ncbi:endonuclease/exonuclease/phosphatase family protein [Candidatus Nitrosotenuis sp. DW1]|uniref:endonuclease/exonuclease/phosphatase family protein n=1 Tax=Candidatus Nitrosotenuis sp. DW1 TaxID=2259672 RepID=UPI0015CD49BD|nr:endonuclease/exonuclease/phosphatase family protein [Candidatus Nitrosotenuis sp. DW1]QLH09447.1 hypothetical protein DSQ19_08150 [Candidatus Nitrosotenuis sp. DW1]
MKKFSILSWNVEHFRLKSKDVEGILGHIHSFDPDVIGMYEVEGKDVYDYMVSSFPNYSFHITEGPQTQEILVGVRGTMTSFLTQRVEFKTGNDFLRPGALLSLHHNDTNYSLLFLHTRSFPEPIGFGTRDSQFQHAFRLKKNLDKKEQDGQARFIILGDLNTMGMKYPFEKSIVSDIELQKLQRDAEKSNMRILSKDHDQTWTDGKKTSNLDHVIASTNLEFKKYGEHDVHVSGWSDLEGAKRKHFVSKISDHNSLYLELV